MKNTSVATVCCAFMLFLALPSAMADETIALHPLKGDSPEVAEKLFDEMVMALFELPAPYIPYLINLEDDVTVDVSSGGLPAYICPQPVLTKDAPYAITGEVIEISGSYYVIRLYLWDMRSRAALISDALIVDADEDEVKYLSHLLAWMLSWIDRDKPPVTPEVIAGVIAEPEYWLHLGLRAGGGDSTWYFNVLDNNLMREYATHFLSGNFALQGAVEFLPWLAFQAELNYCIDFSRPWKTEATEGFFTSSYLTIPLMIRFNWRHGNLMASLFPGVYFYVPLFKTGDDNLVDRFDYKPNQPGFFFGGVIGWKVGPGYLFVDGRFEYDGFFWDPAPPDRAFYRNTARLSLGYELGLLKKNKNPASAKKNKSQATVIRIEEISATVVEEPELSPEEELLFEDVSVEPIESSEMSESF